MKVKYFYKIFLKSFLNIYKNKFILEYYKIIFIHICDKSIALGIETVLKKLHDKDNTFLWYSSNV